MSTGAIVEQLRDCEVSLLDFADRYRNDPDPYDIVCDYDRYHVGYDAENDRPVYCYMGDLIVREAEVRCYVVPRGKYCPLRFEFLSEIIRPFFVWGVSCANVFPVETDPYINYEDGYAKEMAEFFRGYYGMGYKPGQLVKVNQTSCLNKLNVWFYGKIGVVKNVFLATVTDTDGPACSLLCAQLSALPQWSAYASQSIDSTECKDILVPLRFLDPVYTEQKPVDCAGRICQHCKYWDDTKKGVFAPNTCKCTYHSPFITNDNFAQYRKQGDYCNAWEAKDET